MPILIDERWPWPPGSESGSYREKRDDTPPRHEQHVEIQRLNSCACEAGAQERRWGFVAARLIDMRDTLDALLDGRLFLDLDAEQKTLVRKTRADLGPRIGAAVAEQGRCKIVVDRFREQIKSWEGKL